MQFGCARNRNNPRLLCEQPSKRELSRCHLLLFREFAEQINQRLVRFTVLWVKARDAIAEIRVIELRIFVDLAREETLAKWAKWNKSDPEFFKGRREEPEPSDTAYEPTIGLKAVAKILNCSAEQCRRLAEAKKIPAFRIGYRWKSTASAIVRWREEQLALITPFASL